MELFADDKGWFGPIIAPASFHLVQTGQNEKVKDLAEELYKQFKSLNVEIFFDESYFAKRRGKICKPNLMGILLE